MNKPIPFWTYLIEYQKAKGQIHKAIETVLNSGQLVFGSQVKTFEKQFANFCGVRYGIGVKNGTDALFLALNSLEIGPGDEVITVANTAIPTVSAICSTGAKPVFVDINPNTYLIDGDKIEEKITKKTKCILPVHLYGQCCDMDIINKIAKKHRLFVLEDCAQAHGAKWKNKVAGSMSDLAAFSFYPTKPLGGYGDGGMIITNSKKLAQKALDLRFFGIKNYYFSQTLGYNSRLDELQASILIFKLKKISIYLKKRRQIAQRYYLKLKNTPLILPFTHPNSLHSFYLFICGYQDRDKLIDYLRKQDIMLPTRGSYPIHIPLHLMNAFKYLGYQKGDLPITEKVMDQMFPLPVYPELKLEEQSRIIKAIKKFFS